mgnify:CR=1 FL=1
MVTCKMFGEYSILLNLNRRDRYVQNVSLIQLLFYKMDSLNLDFLCDQISFCAHLFEIVSKSKAGEVVTRLDMLEISQV